MFSEENSDILRACSMRLFGIIMQSEVNIMHSACNKLCLNVQKLNVPLSKLTKKSKNTAPVTTGAKDCYLA